MEFNLLNNQRNVSLALIYIALITALILVLWTTFFTDGRITAQVVDSFDTAELVTVSGSESIESGTSLALFPDVFGNGLAAGIAYAGGNDVFTPFTPFVPSVASSADTNEGFTTQEGNSSENNDECALPWVGNIWEYPCLTSGGNSGSGGGGGSTVTDVERPVPPIVEHPDFVTEFPVNRAYGNPRVVPEEPGFTIEPISLAIPAEAFDQLSDIAVIEPLPIIPVPVLPGLTAVTPFVPADAGVQGVVINTEVPEPPIIETPEVSGRNDSILPSVWPSNSTGGGTVELDDAREVPEQPEQPDPIVFEIPDRQDTTSEIQEDEPVEEAPEEVQHVEVEQPTGRTITNSPINRAVFPADFRG